ncbi:oxidoreductase [bacterium]|nr:oxidoreductase [bacterium]
MSISIGLSLLSLLVLGAPTALFASLGIVTLLGIPLQERTISRATLITTLTGLVAALGILAVMLTTGSRFVPIDLGNWVDVESLHFHFHVKFVFDRLSVPFVILTFLLCGTISAFTSRYLHREPGFTRFFLLYSMFLLGMVVSTAAGTIEILFSGWELVGLSSAMLVAYFLERANPAINGLRVWTVYRVSDAAFLVAAIALHHWAGEGDFARMVGEGTWPSGHSLLTPQQALWVGPLLIIAAAGKSALIPFSGWLPRAMEGPTPSSAVFYGSLSVHLGAFLLLRISPVLEMSVFLSGSVVILGLATAAFASMASRVQTDIKSSLAFASLSQVGVIIAEIGFGLRYIALVHMLGHACLRTLQLLRAPSFLRDHMEMENALGARLTQYQGFWEMVLPQTLRDRLYRFALERGYLDVALDEYIVSPLVGLLQQCDRWERRWTEFLDGDADLESDHVPVVTDSLEEWQ